MIVQVTSAFSISVL